MTDNTDVIAEFWTLAQAIALILESRDDR